MVVVAMVVVGGPDPDECFAMLAGVPTVLRSVCGVLACGAVDAVLLGVPADRAATSRALVSGLPVQVHAGPGRADAVRRVLGERDCRDGVVVVHDAARPLAPAALVDAVVGAVAAGHPAALPVLPLSDTVKRVGPDGTVRGTPDRSALRVVQTPWALRADLLDTGGPADGGGAHPVRLLAAHAPVHTVAGHPLAFAVRSAWDRELAELLLE